MKIIFPIEDYITLELPYLRNADKATVIKSFTDFYSNDEMYGIDRLSEYGATKEELNLSEKLWEEYLEYRNDTVAGEEYELLNNWGKDLKLDGMYTLINEKEYDEESKGDNIMEKLLEMVQDVRNKSFAKLEKGKGIQKEVVGYMVDAIRNFGGRDKQEISVNLLDFGTGSVMGITAEQDGYSVDSIPNKKFKGCEFLAYYYVSCKIVAPEMLKMIMIPYDREYETAQDIINLNL